MPAELRVVLGEWQKDPRFRETITTPVIFVDAPSLRDEDLAPLIRDADVLLANTFSKGLVEAASNLRLILTPGAGTNRIDFDAVPDHVAVCNVFCHEVAVAEYVFMSMLALNTDLINMNDRIRGADWCDRKTRPPRTEVTGKTLGVIGLGHIGVEVVRLARAFGMRTIGATRTPSEHRANELRLSAIYPLSGLSGVLSEADFLVIALPLEASTVDLIGEREFQSMKPTCRVINVARGEVVNEAAFYAALKDRRIGGAAIDVWYRYPEREELCRPSAFPFHELPNVIMTPHIAGWTVETFQQRWATIDDNLRRLACGEPLLNVVKPATHEKD